MAAIAERFLFCQNCAWTCIKWKNRCNFCSVLESCNYEHVGVWWQFFAHATHLDNFHMYCSSSCGLISGLGNVGNRALPSAREEGLPVLLLDLVVVVSGNPGAFLWPLQVSGYNHVNETFNWPFQYEHQHKNQFIWCLSLVMIFFFLLMKLNIINPTVS